MSPRPHAAPPPFPDPGVPVEETVGATGEPVDAGTARLLGICNAAAEQVLAAAASALAAVHAEWLRWS